MRSERGTTLVGVLVALTMPAIVFSWPQDISQVPVRNFRRSLNEAPFQLAGRNGCPLTADARVNTSAKLPLAVYAAASSFGFEVDCTLPTSSDQLAIYQQYPGAFLERPSSFYPAMTGPDDGMASTAADTITFFFEADTTTPRADDFVLMRQQNTEQPVPVLRNVLTYPGRPFFQYYYRKPLEDGRRSTQPVPSSWLPLRHIAEGHGTAADTGVAARIDTLRAVEMNYRLTNGQTGPQERIIDSVSTVIPLFSLSPKQSPFCERTPLFSQASMDVDPFWGWSQQLAASHNCPRL